MADQVYEKEHKDIIDSIDESYIYSILGVAEIQSWFQKRVLPSHIVFMKFYKPFLILFKSTSKSNILKEYNDLINSIDIWMKKTNIDEKRMREGIVLFDKYQEILFNTGIITIKRT